MPIYFRILGEPMQLATLDLDDPLNRQSELDYHSLHQKSLRNHLIIQQEPNAWQLKVYFSLYFYFLTR